MAAGSPDDAASAEDRLSRFNTGVPHPARIYNAWLGGKDNFAVDRAAAEQAMKLFPHTVSSVLANRAFLVRVVEYLVGECGIRQFLDIGTGLPSANNTHEVAQAIAPASKIVYVDNDPIVLAHAQALLTSTEAGVTDYIDADLRNPEKILQEAARTLDFSKPVALMLLGVLHFISTDEDGADPYQIMDTLVSAMPPGSYLTITHIAKDIAAEKMAVLVPAMNENMAGTAVPRDREQVTRFFDGLTLLEPGVVPVSKWRPRTEAEAATPTVLWGGVARKDARCGGRDTTPRA